MINELHCLKYLKVVITSRIALCLFGSPLNLIILTVKEGILLIYLSMFSVWGVESLKISHWLGLSCESKLKVLVQVNAFVVNFRVKYCALVLLGLRPTVKGVIWYSTVRDNHLCIARIVLRARKLRLQSEQQCGTAVLRTGPQVCAPRRVACGVRRQRRLVAGVPRRDKGRTKAARPRAQQCRLLPPQVATPTRALCTKRRSHRVPRLPRQRRLLQLLQLLPPQEGRRAHR